MLDKLIEKYSEIREKSKDMKDESFAISVTNRELGIIITSLKMYRAFDMVLDEEIDIKYKK